ncbi:hypothetical protein [Citrobacter werkmanii]|uniref:hypothetical protein n=1 Tax=Citrobacter werkmanii TaxID=67827 RepID=UPI00300C1DD9
MKNDVCMFCGEPATLLCDGNLGFPPKDDRGRECIDAFHPYTCDAPMCGKCGTQMMRMFVSGRKPYAGIHTVDHCPICLRDLPAYPMHVRRIIYSPEQASIVRAAHWAGYRNDLMKRLIAEKGGGQQTFDF